MYANINFGKIHMAQPDSKVIGEGGAHAHRLESPERTQVDGMHKHLFFVRDRLVMTELDGAHWHPVSPSDNKVGPESEPIHKHKISLRTEQGLQELNTGEGSPHTHELQTENTTVSGLHTHTLEIGGEKIVSLLPGDLIQEVENATKNEKGLRDFNIQKRVSGPLEMDFTLVKTLNSPKFKELLQKSVLSSLIKTLSRLADGMRIQALILSKERFVDIGQARRFVLDHNLNVRTSEDRDNVFRFLVMSEDRFQESTLQRIRLTDGVEAIVGLLSEEARLTEAAESASEASLTENAISEDPEPSSSTTSMNAAQDRMPSEKSLRSIHQKLKNLRLIYANEELKPTTKRLSSDKVTIVKTAFEYSILKQIQEKRLVTGPLLVPEKIDLQNEIVSADEIEIAAHNYMTKLTFQKDEDFLKSIGLDPRVDQGFMHSDFTRKLAVVESYIAPVDFTLNERKVVKGTWMATMKIFDDEVWNLIKAGKIRGFSIGGRARLIDEKSATKKFIIWPDLDHIDWEAA